MAANTAVRRGVRVARPVTSSAVAAPPFETIPMITTPHGKSPREAYVPTAAARDLALTFVALQQWGDRWLRDATATARPVALETGEPLHAGFVTSAGREHTSGDVVMKPVTRP